MSDALAEAVHAALNGMAVTGPRPVVPLAQAFAAAGVEVTEDAIRTRVSVGDPNDEIVHQFQLALAQWDSALDADWAQGTAVRTPERRALEYRLLGVGAESMAVFDERVPPRIDQTVVISEDWDPWYSTDVRAEHDFYWSRYRRYLGDTKRWSGDSIAALDDATSHVVERLANPERREAFQARGLVVGYVQSGKTANFTGVIAKAIDAGYRLVIVLTGTVELLRAQTQRRLDMELIGRENLLRGIDESDPALMSDFDYADDEDWLAGRFNRFGFLPSDLEHADIIRLTERRFDYKRLRTAISALEFERHDRKRPLLDPVNLHRSSARLVVVKKNDQVLKKLVTDLKSIRSKLGELPALVIDDESDQASINTNDPAKAKKAIEEGRPDRTAINRLISELLNLLPRAQYVGYTATPFANVFIDPSDAADLFPKHFLISLERPPGYMGVSDFHDIDLAAEPHERTVANSNEVAYVRGLYSRDPEDREQDLRQAIDAFVLAGAVKLYREGQGAPRFKHHTMLVHESVKMAEHQALADQVCALWNGGGYSQPSGIGRLRELWDSDFAPVCAARANGEAVPESFDDLKPFVPVVVARVTEQGPPMLIVNGDKEVQQAKLDFDRGGVWRILVGGTKLSRGFTVEGLTISYYRRRTQAADTLMQMGRWFGFRNGYRDVVRLYIGRNEPDGARNSVDLYEAFEAVVRDEEAFREELRRYAVTTDDGRPQVTPREIPPLVTQHLPWLTPTARNKMFNAKLVVRRWAGEWFEPTAYPLDQPSKRRNFDALRPVLAVATEEVRLVQPAIKGAGPGGFAALIGVLPATTLLAAIRELRWLTADYFTPDLTYFEEITNNGAIEDWLVVLPQLPTAPSRDVPDVGPRRIAHRKRRQGRGGMFSGISDPKHRPTVMRIAGARDDFGDPVLESYVRARRGGLLVYVVSDAAPAELPAEPDAGDLIVTLTFVAPKSAAPTGRIVGFVPRDRSAEDAVVIDA